MTTANQRGGYLKKLSISRDGKPTSITTFTDMFLKKTNNYVLQIPKFIMSVTPPLNLITEVMFEILTRANVGTLPENAPANAILNNQFIAKPYRCWSELARQLQIFFKEAAFDLDALLEDHISFALLDDGCFQLKLSDEFCDILYIRVGPETQKKTGFPEYIFQTRGTYNGVNKHFDHTDGQEYLLAGNPLVFAEFQDDIEQSITFDSRFPLDSFDTRLSQDITVTFPISSKISGLNGKEQREYVLARFPLTDYKKLSSTIEVAEGEVSQTNMISEKLSIGLADLTKQNSEMISIFMLPGEIYHANFQLTTRYFSEGKIVSVPTDMENGFWNIELLFSKKKT